MYMFMLENKTFLCWQKSRDEFGLLYNLSVGQPNDLNIASLILSRRCASSEPYPFFKTILFLRNPRISFRILFSKPPFYFIGYCPGVGLQQPIDPGWE